MDVELPEQSGAVQEDHEEGTHSLALLINCIAKDNNTEDAKSKAMSLGKAKMVYKLKGKAILDQVRALRIKRKQFR